MRPKADIERAIRHIEQSLVVARIKGDTDFIVRASPIRDVLKWATGDDSTPFSKLVMGPCDQVDRARRQ